VFILENLCCVHRRRLSLRLNLNSRRSVVAPFAENNVPIVEKLPLVILASWWGGGF